MIAVIDYDAGNLKSVEKALISLGESCTVTRDAEKIRQADRVILPGVGAFGDAMEKLHRYGLVEVIKEATASGKPFLGICLGLQLLFSRSDEAPGVAGLDILDGEICAFSKALPEDTLRESQIKIPHMGWNDIQYQKEAKLFQGIPEMPYVYFVHSYYLKAGHREDVAATTEYIVSVDASVEHENIFACQFHPEKSGDVGLKILRNFCHV